MLWLIGAGIFIFCGVLMAFKPLPKFDRDSKFPILKKDPPVTKDPYTLSYARGYYYGRTYGGLSVDVEMPMEDLYWRDSLGFKNGQEAGKNDFQTLDLPREAMQHDIADPL